ncbi:CPP1-like family protein [Pleurocapsa sp. PCC 7319]|uniref:CPP1-like family protein n=1 Tax=Pleurocapsa sp. PCC 7319 TaxID=118161 RepID=UPI00034C78A6|nr:CPP1-like family protein [Pleurocapsa sp. PCC 7319]
MSEQNPYEQLGVTENSSFEEIQAAKKRLYEQHGNDSTVLESVEIAYDTIIMDRLRLRQEGKIKVPEKIRFPERTVEKSLKVPQMVNDNSAAWLQDFIDTPSQADILWPTGIFLTLSAIAVFSQNTEASIVPLLMALGFIANIYFLNRKEGRSGRAFLMSFVTLFAGIALGTVLVNLLFSQGNVTVLGGDQFTSAVTFCLFWLVSCFLR